MKDEKYFDEIIKSEVKDSVQEATPSRDIFNEAWNSKDLYSEKYDRRLERMVFYMGKKKIAAVILGVFMGVSALSFGVSPTVRATVKTIFGIDDDGNIVEESEEDTTSVNSGFVAVDDSNRGELGKLLGFEIDFPDEVKEYRIASNDVVNISVKDVKNKDADQIINKIRYLDDYNKVYEELSKDYDIGLSVRRGYCKKNNEDDYNVIILGKKSGDEVKIANGDKVKAVKDIQGIECTVIENMIEEGNKVVTRGEDGAITGIINDRTIKPTGVGKNRSVKFAYNGIVYSVFENDDDINTNQTNELEFAEEYIKILKEKR